MYGLLAALGVSAVAALLLEYSAALRIGGGLLMALLGVSLSFVNPLRNLGR